MEAIGFGGQSLPAEPDQLPTPDSDEPRATPEVAKDATAAANGPNEQPKEPVSILYKVRWEDALEQLRTQDFQSEVPIGPLEPTTESFDGTTLIKKPLDGKPAIEIITFIKGTAPDTHVNDDSGDESEESIATRSARSVDNSSRKRRVRQRRYEPVSFDDIKITRIQATKMIIHSEELLHEIRGVVRYYPQQSLTGDSVELDAPFPVLVHHLDELENLHHQLIQRKDSEWTSKCLHALLQYLNQSVGVLLEKTKARLSRSVPVVTYEDLWFLFKPGTDAYCLVTAEQSSDGNIRQGVVVINTKEDTPSRAERREGKKNSLRVRCWMLESNGTKISRDGASREIPWFEGERQIKTLPLVPSWVQDKEDGGTCRRVMEERGERMYKVICAQPKQMWYDGYLFTARRQKYRGAVIIDASTAIANKDYASDEDTNYGFFYSEITFHSDDSDMLGYSLDDFPWAEYHDIYIRDTPDLPSKHHYFLLGPIIPGFALNDKTWRLFDIEKLKEYTSDSNMESLIIDSANRDIVEAICHAQSNPWKIDSVANKGEGQVALLHGPPGVGKTYTVECIAQATGRPLIALTIGDLLDEDEKIEARLVDWFSFAERWKAILLLDEADIFLERRATRDIQRNGIVSIFLRRIEYFRGLLFLTTNRVGQIDDAFLSRVTVVLQYDHLTDETRKKIWNGFFKKLKQDSERKTRVKDSDDNRRIEVDHYAQKYIHNDEEVRDLRWNGREIRNALQTAISLASYKAIKDGQSTDFVEIEREHFVSVVEMSKKFKSYMSSITGKEEDERAKARQDRAYPRQSILT